MAGLCIGQALRCSSYLGGSTMLSDDRCHSERWWSTFKCQGFFKQEAKHIHTLTLQKWALCYSILLKNT